MNVVNAKNLLVSKGEKTILSVATLSVAIGARVSVCGANGSGKTTLLRVIGGLEPKFSGSCVVNQPAGNCVYVHQTPFLFRGTVFTNAAYGLAAHGIARSGRQKIAMDWLKKFNVDSLANRRVGRLSGGERRRVALARALAVKPKLLLLDEPFADLDDAGCDTVMSVLRELSDDVSVIIASPTPLPPGLCDCEVTVSAPKFQSDR